MRKQTSDPSHMAPSDLLEAAVRREQTIRTVTSHGRVSHYVPVQTPGFDAESWVATDDLDGRGAVVTRAHVRNVVGICQPDVSLVEVER